MITEHIELILLITGGLTAGVFLVSFSPKMTLGRFVEMELSVSSQLLIRHWAFMVGLLGVLLMVAAYRPEYRIPIMLFAMAEKVLMVVLLAFNWKRLKPLSGIIAPGDAVMSVLYGFYLFTLLS